MAVNILMIAHYFDLEVLPSSYPIKDEPDADQCAAQDAQVPRQVEAPHTRKQRPGRSVAAGSNGSPRLTNPTTSE